MHSVTSVYLSVYLAAMCITLALPVRQPVRLSPLRAKTMSRWLKKNKKRTAYKLHAGNHSLTPHSSCIHPFFAFYLCLLPLLHLSSRHHIMHQLLFVNITSLNLPHWRSINIKSSNCFINIDFMQSAEVSPDFYDSQLHITRQGWRTGCQGKHEASKTTRRWKSQVREERNEGEEAGEEGKGWRWEKVKGGRKDDKD